MMPGIIGETELTRAPDAAAMADELRRLFRAGPTPQATALLVRALEAGLDWETVTRAAAEGISARFGHEPRAARTTAAPARARRPVWHGILAGLAIYVALRPLLGLGHELAVATVAWALHGFVTGEAWRPLLAYLPLDPVYLGTALWLIGGVKVQGIAVAGAVGDLLRELFPALFLPPDFVAPGATSSMVAGLSATVIGRALTVFGANVLWLSLGLGLSIVGWRSGRLWLAVLGWLVQAQIVLRHLLQARVALSDVEASGLPFALSVLWQRDGPWFTTVLTSLPAPLLGAAFAGVLLAGAYGCALLVFWLGVGVWRLLRRATRRRQPGRALPSTGVPVPWWASAGLGLMVAASPVGALAMGASNWQPVEPASRQVVPRGGPHRAEGKVRALRVSGPSAVRLEQEADGAWRYLVDGQAEVIRGMGYNPQYAHLNRAERARVYERDFSAMRQIGVNTIEGWFENQFDAVTLEHAARNGLGVLMPFELNQDWDYANPQVQADLLARISAWVERYKGHPAVRMWAPGNEDLHRILFPRWVSQEHVPAVRARADAFADFLVRVADRIHELDPDHPVVYRDAEDVYLPRLKAAFERTGTARPWLIYGANVYTLRRLEEVIGQWPKQWFPGPLLVSEFAPGGVGAGDRPAGFQQAWTRIRSRPDVVVGGLAYTWATNGPEEVDRVFGMVDANGLPRDGVLPALGTAYLEDQNDLGTP